MAPHGRPRITSTAPSTASSTTSAGLDLRVPDRARLARLGDGVDTAVRIRSMIEVREHDPVEAQQLLDVPTLVR